jgi:hypothetical protein
MEDGSRETEDQRNGIMEGWNVGRQGEFFRAAPSPFLLPIFTISLLYLYQIGSGDNEVLVRCWCGDGAVLIGYIQVSHQW